MKVSIVLITWAATKDRMRLLKKTLYSLEDSTKVPYELIVVDNGPKEQTDFLMKEPYVPIDVLITNEKNMGIGYARNQGMEVASGEYICFVDNDVEFKKGWLEECIGALEAFPDEKLFATPLLSEDLVKTRAIAKRLFLEKKGKYVFWQRWGPTCWVLRRSVVKEFGKWSCGTTPGRDYTTRLTRSGYRCVSLTKQFAIHRGAVKSYNYKDKLIGGEWVKHGREYWDERWSKDGFVPKYFRGHDRLFRAIKPLLKGKIADLACGVTSLYQSGEYDVVGVDCSKKAIELCQKLYPFGKFIVGKVQYTKLPKNKFDTVLLISIIEHYGDFRQILLEAKRICKVGGKVIVVVPVKNRDKDHVYPEWGTKKIDDEIASILGKLSYKRVHKWWLIEYEKT